MMQNYSPTAVATVPEDANPLMEASFSRPAETPTKPATEPIPQTPTPVTPNPLVRPPAQPGRVCPSPDRENPTLPDCSQGLTGGVE